MPVTAEERTYLGPDIPFVRRGTGCTQCNGTGYRGRIAIHELVIINRELRELISAGATQAQLTEAARRSQGHDEPARGRPAARPRGRNHPRGAAEDHVL